MVTEASSSKAVPVATGVAVGALIFIGLNFWFSRPFLPSVSDLPTYPKPPSTAELAAAAAVDSTPKDPGEAAYQVCAACHQASGQGIAGTFPPLAGSDWVTKDPETPIRILLTGLSGPIEVKGETFNSLMPPPAGFDDEKIAAVLTYVRANFGNNAPAVDAAKVAEVRASLQGRTTPWTADELNALRAE